MKIVRSSLVLVLLLAACTAPATRKNVVITSAPTRPTEVRDTTIEIGGHVYDARLYVPPPRKVSGVGVVLIGGAMTNDLDWTLPGHLRMNGEDQQVSIDGAAHLDAPRLARVFAERGAVVLHWTTIARDDPKRDLYPYEATLLSMEDLVAQAEAALEAVRAQPLVDPRRIVLVGHSLGGYRAAAIAATDERIVGLVLLASAQLTRTSVDRPGYSVHRQAAGAMIESSDRNGDGVLDRDEALSPAEDVFAEIDFDRDGILRQWEVAAWMARQDRETMEFSTDGPPARDDWGGYFWTEDVIVRRTIPTLMVYGALDEAQAHHAPIIADRINETGAAHATLVVLPGLGHTLGQQRGGLIGPIDDAALSVIGSWFGTTIR